MFTLSSAHGYVFIRTLVVHTDEKLEVDSTTSLQHDLSSLAVTIRELYLRAADHIAHA